MRICFFDSGIGGLTVLAETRKLIPQAEYIYYADVLNCPLGNKTPEEIVAVLHNAIDFFVRFGKPDAVVVACNTATGYGIGKLREDLPDIPFFGVEPAIKPAAQSVTDGGILVLCTNATAAQERFKTLLSRHNTRNNIIVLPLGGLACVIEENFPHNLCAVKEEIYTALAPHRGKNIKGIVLGCTHYIYAKKIIHEMFPSARIFDGNFGTARRIASVLCVPETHPADCGFFREAGADCCGDECIALSANEERLCEECCCGGFLTESSKPNAELKIFTSARNRRITKHYYCLLKSLSDNC